MAFSIDEGDLAGFRPNTVACIPCLNEEGTIGRVVEDALRFVEAVVVVDDGCEDATGRIAEEAGALVLRHPGNLGYGQALQTSFEAANTLGARTLVILDGDGQPHPADIPSLTQPVRAGNADLSIGSRFLDEATLAQVPRGRQFGIRVITKMVNAVMEFSQPITDAQSGFRAFGPKALRSIRLRSSGMGASTEVLWQAQREGLRVTEVPLRHFSPDGGHSQNPVLQGAGVILTTLLEGLREVPASLRRRSVHPRPSYVGSLREEVLLREEDRRLEAQEGAVPLGDPLEATAPSGKVPAEPLEYR